MLRNWKTVLLKTILYEEMQKKHHNSIKNIQTLSSLKLSLFTLVEFFVVISILLVLSSLLLPNLNKLRQFSYQVECQNNLKNISLAVHSYSFDNNDSFPGPCKTGINPKFANKMKYNNSLNVPRKSFSNFQNYIHPYLGNINYTNSSESSQKVRFLKDLVCPANANEFHHDVYDPYHRSHYTLTKPSDEEAIWGQVYSYDLYTGELRKKPKQPKLISQIANPSLYYIIKDANSSSGGSLPSLPIHGDYKLNVLYLDGKVTIEERY